ncbi:hypothetical protein TVAG_252920 [Trichomonas vaginalis G3]|uniref:Spindle assembly abnormal protein 6 N-terminal domain-containing protein n=1 Tax=Trichomonas vaginalis (strain ATCC PRA-98 / G3) TaxID=412133 RepID=A2EXF1_TRIV3|nr:assembly abnormal protein 6-related family [Trichomonas vaginalis G3]EAY02641.1 hypothetical protein TVAG_252920 [Trichomonas vaginalis G3]KAI5550138.1 assembly abnormal protein 6-related family [Trichomonas vaginalis G3]|eukprot:XP_001314864.1 hypothetical protein [Trichomonas vaginalis G3]
MFASMKKTEQTKKYRVPYGTFELFDADIPFTCQNGENKEVINFHLKMSKKRLLDTLKWLKFEITLDSDIFYLIESKFTAEDYDKLIQQSKTKANFEQFAYELLDILRNTTKNQKKYNVTFYPNEDGAKIIIQKLTDLQIIELLTPTFVKANNSDALTRGNNKIEALKQKLYAKESEIKQFFKEIKKKDAVMYDLYFKKLDI